MTADFQCGRCGECCRIPGQIHLTDADITRLAALLKLTEHEFIQRYTDLSRDRRNLALRGDPASPCLFLRGNDCAVYAARPEQCSTYPVKWNNPGWEKICRPNPERV